jgi:hypothetical protein
MVCLKKFVTVDSTSEGKGSTSGRRKRNWKRLQLELTFVGPLELTYARTLAAPSMGVGLDRVRTS